MRTLSRYTPAIGSVVACFLLASFGCGGSSSRTSTGQPPVMNSVPQFGHVALVVEENHSFSEVIGSSAMPYLNSLASKYGLATQYFANTHPSIGDYFMLTAGQVVTGNNSFTGTVNADNVARELIASGKTWKSYAESLPSPGYTGGDVYPYAHRHNPFSYFTDVANSSVEAQNLVAMPQFAADLAGNQLPDFSFIVPNLLDDAHDGTLQAADAWLQQNIGPLISSPVFQKDGLLIIVFDESDASDSLHGGGHVPAVIVSPKAKSGYQSTTLYQHQSTLRLVLEGLGVTSLPGASSTAPDMGEFF